MDTDSSAGKEMDSVSLQPHGRLQLLASTPKCTAILVSNEFLEADYLTCKSVVMCGDPEGGAEQGIASLGLVRRS